MPTAWPSRLGAVRQRARGVGRATAVEGPSGSVRQRCRCTARSRSAACSGGRYRLVAPVGTGASATVYLADDVQLRRRVAVKMLHPSLADDPAFLRRFRAEAQAAAGLNHPNIMAVFDWGEDERRRPTSCSSTSAAAACARMLDRGRLLTPSQALMVGLEAARGLDYAHRRGFVHRDIKPANLLFGEDRRLRIADFGLARALAEAAWTEPAGVLLGTARYASPEQAKGEPLDGKQRRLLARARRWSSRSPARCPSPATPPSPR